MKHHYSHRFFTYSVKEGTLGGNTRRVLVELTEETGSRQPVSPFGPQPKTVPGGEFDWGGTSIKR